MSGIILSNQSLGSEYFKRKTGIDIENCRSKHCTKPPERISAYRPYLLGNDDSSIGKSALSRLSSPGISRNATNLALTYGGDNAIALAGMSAKLKDYNVGLMGSSLSVYSDRIGGFVGSVKNYQKSLMEYKEALSSNSAVKNVTKQKAKMAFQKMQREFGAELKTASFRVKSRRGTPLTSVDRALNIAKSSRNITKLNVTSQAQLSNIVKFTKHAKFLGSGLVLIDVGTRVGNIHVSKLSGKNWHREMFIESLSFGLSAGAGLMGIEVGLPILLAATPVGWVLVIGGLGVAGVVAGTSMLINDGLKTRGGAIYDAIMNRVRLKVK